MFVFSKLDNKSILITGLVICAIVAMFLNYEQIALSIGSGLVGYLSKDVITVSESDNLNGGDK